MPDTKIYIFDRERNVVEFKAGDVIFTKGDAATHLYIVQTGEVEIKLTDNHSEMVESGTFFGEMSLISHEPRSATAIAKTDVKLVPVDEKRFLFMVSETPNFALTVMKVITDRLRKENEIEIALSKAQNKS
ncbi:MAG: cyclic nucleotide-binding domain-containing protein [Chloroflexota bacterium]|nr:cyclic nucleotide-binding domain-containing protein [Chloroflexota bacterium]